MGQKSGNKCIMQLFNIKSVAELWVSPAPETISEMAAGAEKLCSF